MPRLIKYPKADVFNSLISWLDRDKPNVKYTLKAEYVKDGKKYEADCGSLATSDPIIDIMYLLLSNSLYSSGQGVSNPTVSIYTGATSGNVNASTSWLSTSTNLSGATSGSFNIKFSTTISSAVSGTTTVNELLINFNYGQTKSSTGTLVSYIANFGINTQGGTTPCGITVSAGSVITWTLSGQVGESNTNASDSWYVYLWNEIWAEFIAATGVSGAPTGLWQYPAAGTPLFSNYSILVSGTLGGVNNQTIGAYNVGGTVSNTAISNITLNPGTNPTTSGGLQYAPSISFTLTPTNSAVLQSIDVWIYVNGTPPSTFGTDFAATGGLHLSIGGINQSMSANTPYSITVSDSVQVSTNT